MQFVKVLLHICAPERDAPRTMEADDIALAFATAHLYVTPSHTETTGG